MSERLERLRERLGELDVAALLVSDVTNVRYLTGFASSNAWLLVDAERAWLLTDGRYIEAAGAVDGVEAIAAKRNLAKDLQGRLPSLSAGPVGFEADRMTVSIHSRLSESGVELRSTRRAVEALRAVKDEDELDAIRRSSALLMQAFERFSAEPLAQAFCEQATRRC